eukprot:115778_1
MDQQDSLNDISQTTRKISWTCNICTFANESTPQTPLQCQMCHQLRDESIDIDEKNTNINTNDADDEIENDTETNTAVVNESGNDTTTKPINEYKYYICKYAEKEIEKRRRKNQPILLSSIYQRSIEKVHLKKQMKCKHNIYAITGWLEHGAAAYKYVKNKKGTRLYGRRGDFPVVENITIEKYKSFVRKNNKKPKRKVILTWAKEIYKE